MTGMEHAIDRAARALWDYDNADSSAEWRDMAWDDMGGSERSEERVEYELRARALHAAGLLAPAPLREAYVVATWKHTRWVTDHAPDPGETVLRGSHGADALHTECAVCREVLLPARFERLLVDPAEGDGRDEREPTVPASRLRAFARLCVDGGDMNPAAARMLDRIIDGDGRAVTHE